MIVFYFFSPTRLVLCKLWENIGGFVLSFLSGPAASSSSEQSAARPPGHQQQQRTISRPAASSSREPSAARPPAAAANNQPPGRQQQQQTISRPAASSSSEPSAARQAQPHKKAEVAILLTSGSSLGVPKEILFPYQS